jgi:hypothetical protein
MTPEIGVLRSSLSGDLDFTDRYTLVNQGTRADLYLYRIKDKQYLISFDKDNKINYIIIESDENIPEKIKRGASVESCINKQGILMVEMGVCYFVMMKSGWYGYIDDINYDIEKVPDANIRFFYKKDTNDNYFFIEYERYKEEIATIKGIEFDNSKNDNIREQILKFNEGQINEEQLRIYGILLSEY